MEKLFSVVSMQISPVYLASWVISMTFASAQLYLRDIEIIRDMPICGNRSDVQNWDVRSKYLCEIFWPFLHRLTFIFSLFRCICFH